MTHRFVLLSAQSIRKIRKRNGIKCDSPIKILCAANDMYVAEINQRVVFKCGPRCVRTRFKFLVKLDEAIATVAPHVFF